MTTQQEKELIERKERVKKIKAAYADLVTLGIKYPIAIGAHKQIIPLLRGLGHSLRHSNKALTMLIKSTEYQTSVIESNVRFNLDGSVSSPVSEEHSEFAKQLLVMRKRSNTTVPSDNK